MGTLLIDHNKAKLSYYQARKNDKVHKKRSKKQYHKTNE